MRNCSTIAVTVLLLLILGIAGEGDSLQSELGAIPSYNMRTLPSTEPVDMCPGPHLFVDDYLIAESENLIRTTHPPERVFDKPILGWQEGTTQPYLTVIRDPVTK